MIYPHGPIETIADDVFMVRGSIRMNRLLRISRNMGIIREGKALTLINPIRLNASGEQSLRELGEVKNLLRLGAFHGIDDPYYKRNFNAQFWSQPGGTTYPEPPIDASLGVDLPLPVEDSELFEFVGTKHPESALLLRRDGGILFSCDAIQHYGDYSYNNLAARLLMPRIGFPKTTIIGPFWLKLMTPEGGSLKTEFERLLNLQFDKLLSAHGTLLEESAHGAVQAAVQRTFAETGNEG